MGDFFIRVVMFTSTFVACCLTLFLISIGCDIMGYESQLLHSNRYLKNSPHTIKFKNTISSGSLDLPPHVMLPPPHKPTSYQNPICPHAQLICGPAVHLCRYIDLHQLYIFLDWPQTSGIQIFSHQLALPLSARCTLRRHPCNPAYYLMMEAL